MSLNMNDLTVNPGNLDRESFLSDWDWLLDKSMMPVLITAAGDVFVQSQSGSVHFLDTVEGSINDVCANGSEFEEKLKNIEFVHQFFYPQIILDMRNNGLTLDQGQCYSYKKPLVLGGQDDIDNIEVTDVAVHVSIMGQIHKQVKDLPPGTKINNIRTE